MFERFANSWTLVKASASVLSADKELMVFPAISAGLFDAAALGDFGIYAAALYRYAAEGDAGAFFRSELVRDAFRPK